LSLSVGGWKLKQKDLRVPGEGQAQFAVCSKQPMPSTILANKEG